MVYDNVKRFDTNKINILMCHVRKSTPTKTNGVLHFAGNSDIKMAIYGVLYMALFSCQMDSFTNSR